MEPNKERKRFTIGLPQNLYTINLGF